MNTSIQEAIHLFSNETIRLEQSFRALQLAKNLEMIVEHMPEGLLFVNTAGLITMQNRAAISLLGRDGKNHPFTILFHDSLFGFSMKRALEEQKLSFLSYLTLEDQKEIEVSASFIASLGVLLLLRDVTQVVSASLTAHDRLSLLGEMAATLAHEIRNPLGGIEGFASLLLHDLKDDVKKRGMVENILEGTRLLGRLVSDVLNFARPLVCNLRPYDLGELIEEAILLGGKSIVFEKKSLTAIVDVDSLKSALLNLFHNAFESGATLVSVRIEEEGGFACIAIVDNGSGIEEKHLEKIFTPFFTTKTKGTGIGLAEVQKIASAHGGSIFVSSKLREGSTFTLKVPCLSNKC